jgi:hypothetical protein
MSQEESRMCQVAYLWELFGESFHALTSHRKLGE